MAEQSAVTDSHDEPLLVLRYNVRKVRLRVLTSFFLLLMLLGIFLNYTEILTVATIVLGMLLLAFLLIYEIVSVIYVIYQKEVRLYKDRIVRVSPFFGERELRLARAKLVVRHSLSMVWPRVWTTAIAICDPDISLTWQPITGGVVFNGRFADREDMRKLKIALATLSGRPAKDFDQTNKVAEPLIKEGSSPRVATKRTPDEEINRTLDPVEYEREEKYNRAEIRSSFVLYIFVMVGVCLWALVLLTRVW